MIDIAEPILERICCEAVGKPKLFITVTENGIYAWCKVCHIAHFVSYERLLEAKNKGNKVFCEKDKDTTDLSKFIPSQQQRDLVKEPIAPPREEIVELRSIPC